MALYASWKTCFHRISGKTILTSLIMLMLIYPIVHKSFLVALYVVPYSLVQCPDEMLCLTPGVWPSLLFHFASQRTWFLPSQQLQKHATMYEIMLTAYSSVRKSLVSPLLSSTGRPFSLTATTFYLLRIELLETFQLGPLQTQKASPNPWRWLVWIWCRDTD